MGEHLVVNMEQLPKPEVVEHSQPVAHAVSCGSMGKKSDLVGSTSSSTAPEDEKVVVVVEDEDADEQAPLIGMGECRICQEEDSINNLESPCACSGSLKYAHRKCVQYWCNEKGDITCEICHQPYQPGYTAPARPPSDETSIDIGGVWQISGTTLDMHDPRLLAIAEAERQLFEADYDDYNGTNNSGTAFCRSAALILMALLLLRHALSITDDGDGEGDDDASTFFSLFLLRAVGFLLPCYIMIWAISILQRRRQRQARGRGSGSCSICNCCSSSTKQRSSRRLSCAHNHFTGDDSSPRTCLIQASCLVHLRLDVTGGDRTVVCEYVVDSTTDVHI